jgi:hypothetical protein
MQAALFFSASVSGATLPGRRSVAPPAAGVARRRAATPRRAARAPAVAVRAAAAGKTYICIDCGWLYVPSNQKGVALESLKSFQ